MLDSAIPAGPADDFGVPAQPPQTLRHRPVFSGRTGEYFGIWFVNLLLSILTLGIYSAWAKVRTERYFYGNTRLAGASFDYLASPIAILKGRLLAYAVVIALGVSSHFSPGLYLVLLLAVAVGMPALIVLGLRFRARNSAWRGVSFRFEGGKGEAYGPFMGWPILSSLTLSLLYPMSVRRQHEFVVENHRFGMHRFDFSADAGPYYVPYLIVAGLAVALFIGFAVMLAAVGISGVDGGQSPEAAAALGFGMVATLVAFYAGMFVLGIFIRVRYANLFWNSARLGEHRFESTLRVGEMLWIYFTNALAIVCTIGLAVPWAMVRLARYRAEHFSVLATGSIDDFAAGAAGRTPSFGEEMVDALDVGVELGI
jgi:uncharacterized membrane protein YjgN (DUF898 family)